MIPAILNVITGNLFKSIASIARDYIEGKKDAKEFERDIAMAQSKAQAEIEVAWTEAAAKMAESVHATVRVSPAIARAYASVMFLQLSVLTFYQIGAPAYQVITGQAWPNPGVSLEWSYLLLAATLGAWPLVKR